MQAQHGANWWLLCALATVVATMVAGCTGTEAPGAGPGSDLAASGTHDAASVGGTDGAAADTAGAGDGLNTPDAGVTELAADAPAVEDSLDAAADGGDDAADATTADSGQPQDAPADEATPSPDTTQIDGAVETQDGAENQDTGADAEPAPDGSSDMATNGADAAIEVFSDANSSGCTNNGSCASLEDGDLCNGTLYCDTVTGQCKLNPITVVKCDSSEDSLRQGRVQPSVR